LGAAFIIFYVHLPEEKRRYCVDLHRGAAFFLFSMRCSFARL